MENNQNSNFPFDPFRQTVRDVNANWPDPIGPNRENIDKFAHYYLIIEALVKEEEGLKKDSGFQSNLQSLISAIKTGTLENLIKEWGGDTHPF